MPGNFPVDLSISGIFIILIQAKYDLALLTNAYEGLNTKKGPNTSGTRYLMESTSKIQRFLILGVHKNFNALIFETFNFKSKYTPKSQKKGGKQKKSYNKRGLSCAKLSQQSTRFLGPIELFFGWY